MTASSSISIFPSFLATFLTKFTLHKTWVMPTFPAVNEGEDDTISWMQSDKKATHLFSLILFVDSLLFS